MEDDKKGLKDSFVDALISLGPALTAGAGSKNPTDIYNAYVQGVTQMEKREQDRFNRTYKIAQLRGTLEDRGRPNYDLGFVDKKSGQVLKIDKNTGQAYDMQGEIFGRPEDIVEGETYRQGKSLPFRDRAVTVSETKAQLAADQAQALTPKQIENHAAVRQVKYQIERIRNLKEGVDTGPVAAKYGAFLAMFDRAPKGFSALRVETGSVLANYVKSISGAQVSDKEMDRLMHVIPRLSDQDTEFVDKLNQFEKIVDVGGTTFLEAIRSGSPLKRETIDAILEVIDPQIDRKQEMTDNNAQIDFIKRLNEQDKKPFIDNK